MLSRKSLTVDFIPPPAAVVMMSACLHHQRQVGTVHQPAVRKVVEQGLDLPGMW